MRRRRERHGPDAGSRQFQRLAVQRLALWAEVRAAALLALHNPLDQSAAVEAWLALSHIYPQPLERGALAAPDRHRLRAPDEQVQPEQRRSLLVDRREPGLAQPVDRRARVHAALEQGLALVDVADPGG